MNERLKVLRKTLEMNQKEFSEKIGISQSALTLMENGKRTIRDVYIAQMCHEFNVNEEWLRTGKGEMFVQPATFSLDEYAQKNQLTELELDIIKSYMDLNKDVRQSILATAQQLFAKHTETVATTDEDDIEAELKRYRQELEAEKKVQTSLVSQKLETS